MRETKAMKAILLNKPKSPSASYFTVRYCKHCTAYSCVQLVQLACTTDCKYKLQ